MPGLKQMITGSEVHGRSIQLKTYPAGDGKVIVTGELRDLRHRAVFDLTGEEQAAGPIHHLVLRLLLHGETKEILDVEAEMIHVPHAECAQALETLPSVVGLKVERGFIKQVSRHLGGVRGCSHLSHLLTVMAQEVFQGLVVVQREKKRPAPVSLSDVAGLDSLVGSCRMWSEDGIKLRKLRKIIEERDKGRPV